MILLIDTNVIIDVILERPDFVDDSLLTLEKAITIGDRVYISSSSVTDIYYIIKRFTKSKEFALKSIQRLASIIYFAEVNSECILSAMQSRISDFEDAVVDEVASNISADYIITRNIADFREAKTKIISPREYLDL